MISEPKFKHNVFTQGEGWIFGTNDLELAKEVANRYHKARIVTFTR